MWLKVALGVVLGGIVLVGACTLGFSLFVGGVTAVKEEAERQRKVTASEFSNIRDGMTYQQVVKIVGENGDELSRTSLGGITTVIYSWTNSDFSNMNAMFQNGKLVSKAQFGLK